MEKKMNASYIFEEKNTHLNVSQNSISWHLGCLKITLVQAGIQVIVIFLSFYLYYSFALKPYWT